MTTCYHMYTDINRIDQHLLKVIPMAEPDFLISVPLAFFEETFKYERRRPENFVSRPDGSMWMTKEKIENYGLR